MSGGENFWLTVITTLREYHCSPYPKFLNITFGYTYHPEFSAHIVYQSSQVGSFTGQLNASLNSRELAVVP